MSSSLKKRWLQFNRREKILSLVFTLGFFVGLILLFIFLVNQITAPIPKIGGKWRIAIVGEPRFINPVLNQNNDVDRNLEELVYNGLYKIDGRGGLIPDLADHEEISPDGKIYNIFLKEGVLWHDGEELTADDIVFTIETIQNSDYQSPLRLNWQGVAVEKLNKYLVRFTLKNPYEPFLQNLTLKILPKHIWENIEPGNFPLAQYNLKPIGTGPYLFEKFQKNDSGKILSYTLESNRRYFAGEPNLKTVIYYFFDDFNQALKSLLRHQVDSLINLANNQANLLAHKNQWQIKKLILPRYYAIFFNTTKNQITADKKVREALALAINKPLLIEKILNNQAELINTPIGQGIFGYQPELNKNEFDLNRARQILSEENWQDKNQNGILEKTYPKQKTETELTITITLPDNQQLQKVAEFIKDNWTQLGVKTELKILPLTDLEKNAIRPRNYEALLFGNIIGQDPDLFAFWHSSQVNDPGLNLTLYQNQKLDSLLEETRQINNQSKRLENLKAIQNILLTDRPAIFLYNPYYLFAETKKIKGQQINIANYPSERLSDIHNWYFYTRRVFKLR